MPVENEGFENIIQRVAVMMLKLYPRNPGVVTLNNLYDRKIRNPLNLTYFILFRIN